MSQLNCHKPDEYVSGDLTYALVYIPKGQLRLKISGSGRIPGNDVAQLWRSNQSTFTEIWIDEGITEIGKMAFSELPELERLWLPESLQKIGAGAFSNCPSLAEIVYFSDTPHLNSIEIAADALPEWFYRERRELIGIQY